LKLRTVAAAVSLVNGAWTVAAGAYWSHVFQFQQVSPTMGPENVALLILGIVLLLDSLACFFGLNQALYVSAAISLLSILDIAAGGVQLSGLAFIASGTLSAITIALDVVGARRRVIVLEKDHPLNMPVFG
jgi:hypothetical protein